MRALIVDNDTVTLSQAPDPQPAPRQAVIRVEAISLNRGEVTALATARPGTVWGWDAAGTVEAPASDGSGPATGTRVVGLAIPPGAWGELAAIDTARLAPIPDDVSARDASTLPVAGLTALYALEANGPLLGRRVLVTGATGGVGRFAIQLAQRGGAAHVTAVVRDPDAASTLTALGADALVDAVDPDGPPEDIVVESLGGPTMANAVKRVGPDGVLVTLGDTSGQPITLAAFDLYPNRARIEAVRVFSEVDRRPSAVRDLAYLASGLSDGWLDPGIDRVTDWGGAPDVIRALRNREVHGKAVLTVD